MSVADKMVVASNNNKTITDNEQRVYDAGYTKGWCVGYPLGTQVAESKPYINTSEITNFSYFFASGARLGNLDKVDTSNGTNFSYAFFNCTNIDVLPYDIDTSKGTNFLNMFNGCTALTEININTSKGTNFRLMFHSCKSIVQIDNINVSNSTDCYQMFFANEKLTTISSTLNVSKCTEFSGMFAYCQSLINVSFTQNSIKYDISFGQSSKLSDESIQSIINGLATVSTTRTLKFSSTVINKLTDEQLLQIANKNWSIG